jgi:hypothetical protein
VEKFNGFFFANYCLRYEPKIPREEIFVEVGISLTVLPKLQHVFLAFPEPIEENTKKS